MRLSQHQKSEELVAQVLETGRGGERPQMLSCNADLEQLELRVLAAVEKKFGPKHPNTLNGVLLSLSRIAARVAELRPVLEINQGVARPAPRE